MMSPDSNPRNRRQFARVKAPVFCRSARLRTTRRPVVDIGKGGVRVYSDEAFAKGERLDLELFLPDDSVLRCLMRVVWVSTLPDGAPAHFDVGLQLLDIKGEGGIERLEQVLDRTD